MSITLKKIEADIYPRLLNNNPAHPSTSTSDISIADLIKFVNTSDGDFLRYSPDELLSAEQIEAKNIALKNEYESIEGLRYSIPEETQKVEA